MTMQFLLLVILFFVVVAVTTLVVRYVAGAGVRSRLRALSDQGRDEGRPAEQAPAQKAVLSAARVLAQVAEPEEGWNRSPLRQKMMHAGLMSENAPAYFTATKIALTVIGAVLALLVAESGKANTPMSEVLMMVLAGAFVGFILPELVVRHKTQRRQTEIRNGLPDAADFLVVCVEAGSGLDAAFTRVAEEMAPRNPILAQQMQQVTLEVRAGREREVALRNLAERTGVEEIVSMANMLTQADRFGTSMGEALRVYAEMLRTLRKQRAEEAAAKIPVKLLIPMIFCIFPALLVVVAGPAFINILRVLLPGMGGGN